MTDTLRINSKSQLRTILRQRRRTLSPSAQLAAAQAVLGSIRKLPTWTSARRVALYLAADGEVDTRPLEQQARELGKLLFLPAINEDNSLRFLSWHADETLSTNRYNIPEPPATATCCPAVELDIIFLPLVGWDLRGRRLGMGGGFYDRTLSGVVAPLLVGLAHENQQVEDIPQDSWDVVLDYIATDTALYRSQGL
jgi:5-formyltetrahydrofolate cyclo-ligase